MKKIILILLAFCFLNIYSVKAGLNDGGSGGSGGQTTGRIGEQFAYNNTSGGWTDGLNQTGQFNLPNALPEIILTNFLLWITSILALLAALAFVISGVMFLTSGGNPEQTTRAKDFIKYSIIGLIVSLSAYIIIMFIDNVLMGFYF